MFTVYVVVTIFAAAANTYAAIVDFRRPQWLLDNMTKWGGSHSWLFPLGSLKATGALGLLVGIGVRPYTTGWGKPDGNSFYASRTRGGGDRVRTNFDAIDAA
jgi:hypothetical protein